MVKSIRGRLQWWYGGVYALSIIVFGCLVYWRAARDMNERATLQAVSTAQYLDVSLRNFRLGPPRGPRTSNPAGDRRVEGDRNPVRKRGVPGGGLVTDQRRDGERGNDPFPDNFSLGPLPPEFQFGPHRGSGPGRRGDVEQNYGRAGDEQPALERRHGAAPGPDRRQPRIDLPVPGETTFEPSGGPSDSLRSDEPRGPRPPIDHMDIVIFRSNGAVLTRSDGGIVECYLVKPDMVDAGPPLQLSRSGGLIQVAMRGPADTTILVLRPIGNDVNGLHRFGYQICGMAISTLLIGIVGGWWVAGRMVRPIQMISDTASQISAANLDHRIETSQLDHELVQLATVLNGTFERLEQSFGRLTQFTADASHELRTPLAVIQSQMELALSQPRTAEAYQQTLATCLQSSERMRLLVDGLLLLARTDSDRVEMRPQTIDLRNLVDDAVAQLAEKASSAGVELECSTPATAVPVSADVRFLTQVPVNLIDNAIQHSSTGGKIFIDVRCEDLLAVLTVRDTGCGIAEQHLPRLFERFYRVDTARSRQHGGSGLGLAICRSLVEANGGTIVCESTLDVGSIFVVELPLLINTEGVSVKDVQQ